MSSLKKKFWLSIPFIFWGYSLLELLGQVKHFPFITTYKLDQLYTFSKKTTESEGGSVSKDATTLKNASYGDYTKNIIEKE